jgi:hypothetical protein
MLLLAHCAPLPPQQGKPAPFGPPQRVTIDGYDGDIMEPALSRDGKILFFNNRNDPPEKTDLHWAERTDDLHFRYRGLIAAANSPALDGVPTLASGGRLCFISTRAYAQTLATVHCGDWLGDRVTSVTLQAAATPRIPGRVVFDIELAPSGDYAIIADGRFTGGPVPASADLRLARGRDSLVLDPASDALFASINTPALEYAAALSADALTLCFTRIDGGLPSLWLSHRTSEAAPFGAPERITAATGFVEAGAFAPDGAIYFHKLDGARFTLWRMGAS